MESSKKKLTDADVLFSDDIISYDAGYDDSNGSWVTLYYKDGSKRELKNLTEPDALSLRISAHVASNHNKQVAVDSNFANEDYWLCSKCQMSFVMDDLHMSILPGTTHGALYCDKCLEEIQKNGI